MPANNVRKHRIYGCEAIIKLIEILDKIYGQNITSVIVMGSRGTEEVAKEGDIDLEIIFKSDFFRPELSEEIHSLVKISGFKDMLDIWVLNESDVIKQNLKFLNYPKNILCNHIYETGLVLKGKNLLEYFKVEQIPRTEILELLNVAKLDFQRGCPAKAVLKAALALILKQNDGKPIDIKNHLYYRSICEAAQKYLNEKDFAVVYKALRVKRGFGKLRNVDVARFLRFVEQDLSG